MIKGRRGNKVGSSSGPMDVGLRPLLLAELDTPHTGRFRVFEGEQVVLLGSSGSGKTTLIRELLGLTGRATSRRGSRLAERCGYVPQSDGVFLDLTVLDNVRRPSPHVPTIPAADALDWLDLVGLSDSAHLPVSDLSTAARRRVSVARALSRHLPLLIIDGDLDGTLKPLLSMLLECVPHLSSVVTATCTADNMAESADSVVLVDNCAVVAQGPLSELHDSPDPQIKSVLSWVTP